MYIGLWSPRMDDAVQALERCRLPNGHWPLHRDASEALAVSTDERIGDASRWNTLRALRWYRQ